MHDHPTQGLVRLALAGALAMAVGVGIGRFVYTPILPPMTEALGLSRFLAGLIASANFTGYLVGALLLTRARLPGSPRAVLTGALLVSAATTAAMGLAGSVPLFLLLRFTGGVASALALILSSSMVLERLARAGRPGLAALHFAGVGLGIAASAVLVTAMSAAGWDWAGLWWASGALSLVGAILVRALVGAPMTEAAGAATAGGRVGNPALRRMTIAYGLFGFGYVITATFLVAIVRETPASRDLEPLIWVVVGLAAAPSIAVWTRVARRLGTAPGYAAAALTEALGVLVSVSAGGMISLAVAGILLGGTFMGLTALGLMRARELAPDNPRPALAALTGAFGVGQIAGPVVAGFLSDLMGGLLVPSLLAAAGLVVAAWLARR